MVGTGFKRPGIYHVHRDISLAQMLQLIQPLAHLSEEGLPHGYCGLQLQQNESGRLVTRKSRGWPERELSAIQLKDGAQVTVVNLVKWTL